METDQAPKLFHQLKQFINYRTELKGEKLDKIPIGHWNSQDDWRTLEQAKKSGLGDGVGIVLTHQHKQDTTLLCVDFDKVVGTPIGFDILDSGFFEYGWMEQSVSGRGYHLFLLVHSSEFKDKDFGCRFLSDKFGPLEVYTKDRFIALTFNSIEDGELDQILTLGEVEKLLGIEFIETKRDYQVATVTWSNDITMQESDILGKGRFLNSGDQSKDVFAWVASVIGYCSTPNQLLDCFYKTKLCSGDYCPSTKDKLRRTLKYMLKNIDVEQEKVLANPSKAFEDVESPSFNEALSQQIKDYKFRYAKLLEEKFHCAGQVKRNIFDGFAYIKINGQQTNIESEVVVKTLRDEVRVINKFADKENKYKASEVDDSMTAYRMSLKPELLLDIEDWDGTDRFKILSKLVNFADKENITPELFEYFLKDWSVMAVHKVMRGSGNQRMLVLQGPQGVGKDSFFSLLCGGWGNYFLDITKPSQFDGEKVLLEQCVKLAVGSLRELDLYDPVQIKRLVDNPTFTFRESYGKHVVEHKNRISFVASCNPKSPFKDATGNRRFLFFAIAGRPDTEEAAINHFDKPIAIKRDIDDQDEGFKKQVLAQAFYLWRENGQRPLPHIPEYEAVMAKLLESVTPEDTSVEIVNEFVEFLSGLQRERLSFSDTRKLFTKQDLNKDGKFKKFCDDNQMKMSSVLLEVKNSGGMCSKETYELYSKNKTFYHLKGQWTKEEREKYKQYEVTADGNNNQW